MHQPVCTKFLVGGSFLVMFTQAIIPETSKLFMLRNICSRLFGCEKQKQSMCQIKPLLNQKLNQNFPIRQVLFSFFSFWIFMLISTNSSRRLRCRNILVEKNNNKMHLHYLKKKKANEISLLLEDLLSNMWKRSRWKIKGKFFILYGIC